MVKCGFVSASFWVTKWKIYSINAINAWQQTLSNWFLLAIIGGPKNKFSGGFKLKPIIIYFLGFVVKMSSNKSIFSQQILSNKLLLIVISERKSNLNYGFKSKLLTTYH